MAHVTAELTAITEQLRGECQRLLLDAIDAAEKTQAVRARLSSIEDGVLALARGNDTLFSELLSTTGCALIHEVIEHAGRS